MDADEPRDLLTDRADGDPLAGLEAIPRMRGEVERAEAVLVRRARNAGATWAQIAEALGVSKQAVHKKHGGRRLMGRPS